MAGFKETPRQKMISMMYLILTALLALNVSVDILDAFAIVNDGLEVSNASVESKIEDYYTTFQQQYDKQSDKVAPYWEKAKDIREKTDEIINYIEKEVKLPLVMRTENLTEEEIINPEDGKKALLRNKEKANAKNRRIFYEFNLKNVNAKDKYDEPTNFMINEGKATELREKIDAYRKYIVNTITDADIMNYGSKVGLFTTTDNNGNPIIYVDADGKELDWERKNFYHVILAADIAILNKIIGEIQTTEFDAISELFKRIGATDYKFNALEARVMPKSTYILTGQDYEADIFIAASDTTRKFDVRYARGVNDFSKAKGNILTSASEGGVVRLKFPGTSSGIQEYAGVVEMIDPETGEKVPYSFQSSYTVAPPSATIAPTQMMIFYQGLKNPISVSSPGIPNDKIQVSITQGKGTISKGDQLGMFIVEVPAGEKVVTVTASANMDGKITTLGSYDFRVKRVPAPTATIAGISGGKLDKNSLIASGCIIPDMGDFDFGNYNYEITSYTLSTIVKGDYKTSGTVRGGMFNDEVKKTINSAIRGNKLFFENIQAKGPDGATRTLNPINIEIK